MTESGLRREAATDERIARLGKPGTNANTPNVRALIARIEQEQNRADEAHSRAISAHALAKSRGEWADTLQAEIRGFKTALSDADALLAEALRWLRLLHRKLERENSAVALALGDTIAKIEAAIGSTTETGGEG